MTIESKRLEELRAERIGGFAPGNYECPCCLCGERFIGNKRAIMCQRCAFGSAILSLRADKAKMLEAVDEATRTWNDGSEPRRFSDAMDALTAINDKGGE